MDAEAKYEILRDAVVRIEALDSPVFQDPGAEMKKIARNALEKIKKGARDDEKRL